MSDVIDQIDASVLEALREHARRADRTLADVLSEAGRAWLENERVRPSVRTATAQVVEEHAELLARLAK